MERSTDGDFMQGTDGAIVALYVWPDLLPAVDAFSLAAQTVIGGMGTFHAGIMAQETRAALLLAGCPRRLWPQAAADVIAMGRTVAETMNAKLAKRQ